MASSLSNTVDNLAEGFHKIKWKDCNCSLEYESVKDNLIKLNVYLAVKKLDEKFKKKFKNKFKYSNNDIYKFILLFRKGVYPYE